MDNENSFSILVIDDEDSTLDLVDTILSPEGYKTYLFKSPIEAMEKLKSGFLPDLIISDILMPKMSGFQLFEEVQKISSLNMIPFIFLSSIYNDETIQYGKELGVDDYLQKPFTRNSLLSSVKGKIKRSKRISANVLSDIESIKQNILQVLSHELKTPITTMSGYLNFLTNDNSQFSLNELRGFNEIIKQGGNRLQNLVEDYFESLSIETGEMIKSYDSLKNEFPIETVINESLLSIENEIKTRKLEIVKNIEPGLPAVFACLAHIKNIICRILNNAIKFSDEKNKIQIDVRLVDNYITVSIRDWGTGLPENEIQKIYDKFYQINQMKKEQQGPGLGLFIAKRLAEINKCCLTCESKLNAGTTFTLEIPLSASQT